MTRSILVILLLTTFGTSAFAGDPKRAAVHNKQAKAYFEAKQFDDAILEFKKSYELDPKPLTLYKIASAYYAKGDYKGAIENYQKYLSADPEGPFAAQAIEFSTLANKALADEAAKQHAVNEAARVEAERKAAVAATERKRVAATARIKQAEAYAKANAWGNAGQEYTAATEIDGDPSHLLDAADAFHKQPDDVKSRDALLAYLDRVPVGDKSDQIRVRVADLTRAIDKAAAEERSKKEALAKANAGNETANNKFPGGVVLPAYLASMASMVPTTAVMSPARSISFGFELRGGIYGPGDYMHPDPVATVGNRAGPAGGVGAFIDFPIWTESHIHAGLRAWYFKSSYDSCSGLMPMTCPTHVSAPFVGPAVTLDASLFHQGKVDVYAIVGFSLDVALRGAGRISFYQGPQDEHLSIEKQAQAEAGVGVRFSPVSIDAVYQTSLSEFREGLPVEKAKGILFAVGWSLPR
jgi:hypothetical protein